MRRSGQQASYKYQQDSGAQGQTNPLTGTLDIRQSSVGIRPLKVGGHRTNPSLSTKYPCSGGILLMVLRMLHRNRRGNPATTSSAEAQRPIVDMTTWEP